MSAWDTINGVTQVQPSPNFLYYLINFAPGEYRRTMYYRVAQGYGYLIRGYKTACYSQGSDPLGGGQIQIFNPPAIEFFIRRQSRQTNPVPMNCESTPCEDGATDLINYPYLKAAPLKSGKAINYFVQFGDTLEFHIVRKQNVYDLPYIFKLPIAYSMHLVLNGYDVPEPLSRIW